MAQSESVATLLVTSDLEKAPQANAVVFLYQAHHSAKAMQAQKSHDTKLKSIKSCI
jgi:hypothetical protein